VTCCLCFPIRIGVGILAILALLGASGYIVNSSVTLAVGIQASEKTTHADTDQKDGLGVHIATYVVQIGFGIVHLLFSIILIRGLVHRKPQHLKTWVIFKLVLLGISVASLILTCAAVVVKAKGGDGAMRGIMILLFGGLVLLLEYYYIWVVRRYARIMENEDEITINVTHVIAHPQKA